MDIVGSEKERWEDDHVHTIDIWYSRRRGCWVVERLNLAGDLVGTAHCCASQHDAEACLADWLRAHDEAHLTAARQLAEPTEREPIGHAPAEASAEAVNENFVRDRSRRAAA